MSIAHDFNYHRPQSLIEVLELLEEYKDKARILAGGTDLIVNIKEAMIKPELLIDIKDLSELSAIDIDGNNLHIGAGITFSALIASSDIREGFPILWDAAKTVASTGVRSRATLTGNICSAVPSLDSAPPLLCYEAVIHVASLEGKRDIPVSDWFLAPRKTALRPNELVTGITLEKPLEKHSGIYLKLGRYGGEDLAQAGWGILQTIDKRYKIAHCALAPTPKRAYKIESVLNGNPFSEELIQTAIDLIPEEIVPITDIRSSKEYRLYMSSVMLRRGLKAVKDRFDGKDVDPAKLLGGN